MALTRDGTLKEYSQTLPDGRIIMYSLEEKVFEDKEDIEITSSRTVTTCDLERLGGILESLRTQWRERRFQL